MSQYNRMPELTATHVPAGATAILGSVHVLKRHKLLFAAVAVSITAVTTVVVLNLTPLYTATAAVTIRPEESDPLARGSNADTKLDDGAVDTQVDFLKSQGIVQQVVSTLGVDAAAPPRSMVMNAVCENFPSLSACAPQPPPSMNFRVAMFIKNLTVLPNGRSRVLNIAYTNRDPELAAKAVNLLVETVQQQQIADQTDNLKRTTAWLDARATELSGRLSAAEAKAGAFRAATGLNERTVGTQITPLVADQVASASADYSAAQAQLAAAEARSGAGKNAVHVAEQPLVIAAASNLATLTQQRAQMSQNFGDRYPPMIALNNQIAEAERKLASETGRAAATQSSDTAAKREEVARLGRNLAALRTQGNALNGPQVQMRQLDREAASASTIYQTFFERAREIADRTALLQPNMQFVAHATVPDGPSFPQTDRFLLAGLMLGLVGGAGAAFGRDYLTQGVSMSGGSSGLLALPLLASVPAIPVHRRLRVSLPRYVEQNPFSPAAESIRSLAAQLTLAGLNADQLGSVVITSATAEEGKSTICLWLAQAVAATGQRALIIDGDHRNGTLHKIMQKKNGPGLTDWVAGRATFDAVVQLDETTGLDFMPAGSSMSRPFSQAELNRLRSMLTRIKQIYGVVIIDAPPVLAMSDPLLYASLVDHTVLVSRWERTSRAAVATAVERLRAAGASITGLVLSMVDPSNPDRYGEGVTKRDIKLLQRYYAG